MRPSIHGPSSALVVGPAGTASAVLGADSTFAVAEAHIGVAHSLEVGRS